MTKHMPMNTSTCALQMPYVDGGTRSTYYEDEPISNQPILFPMDRDSHDFHTLFQYMFYTWVQNCTLIELFFDKILNVKHG